MSAKPTKGARFGRKVDLSKKKDGGREIVLATSSPPAKRGHSHRHTQFCCNPRRAGRANTAVEKWKINGTVSVNPETQKKKHLTLRLSAFVVLASTYLPGPLPAEYCQRK